MSEQPIEGAPLEEKSVSELTPEEIKELEKAKEAEEKAEAKEEVPSFEVTDEPPFEAPTLYPIEFFHELIKDMRIDFDTRSKALDTASKFNPASVDDLLAQAQRVENYLVTGDPKTELVDPPA